MPHYEVFVQPDNGPAMKNERDEKGNYAWKTKEEAIALADKKKKFYPPMDFMVHEVVHNSSRKLVYQTRP
jgi:hypothetical protein